MARDDDSQLREEDRNFAANFLRLRKEAGLSQEEVADRMTAFGFPFSQATVWKIEALQRPVKIAEAVALASLVDDPYWPLGLFYSDERVEAARSVYRALEQIHEARHQIEEWTRLYLDHRREFNQAWETAERVLPTDDPFWYGYDGSDWESPEYIALDARSKWHKQEAERFDEGKRRAALGKAWNRYVQDEEVLPGLDAVRKERDGE